MTELAAANIQVFTGEDAPDDLARRLAKTIKEMLARDGYEPVGSADASTREMAIVISSEKGRATVLDEASDADPQALETLARELSQQLDALTVSVQGNPSASTIALHGGGATLSSLPGDAQETELHAAWAELLVGGNTPSDLRELWFAPGNPLLRTGEILAIEGSLFTVCHASLGRLGRAGVRLRFTGGPGLLTNQGPRLRAAPKPGQQLSPNPGETFKVDVVAQNRGAPGAGVEVTLRGRLLSEDWLEVRSVALAAGEFHEEQRPRFRVVRNDRVVQVCFEKAPLRGAGTSEVLNLTLECQLTRAMSKSDSLHISFDPMGSASGGCAVDIEVGPPNWRY